MRAGHGEDDMRQEGGGGGGRREWRSLTRGGAGASRWASRGQGWVVTYGVAVEGAAPDLEATAALLLLGVGGDRVIGTGAEGADRRGAEGALCDEAESHVVVSGAYCVRGATRLWPQRASILSGCKAAVRRRQPRLVRFRYGHFYP